MDPKRDNGDKGGSQARHPRMTKFGESEGCSNTSSSELAICTKTRYWVQHLAG